MTIVYEYLDSDWVHIKLITTETSYSKVLEFVNLYERQFGLDCEHYYLKELFRTDDRQEVLNDLENYHIIHVDMDEEIRKGWIEVYKK